jgi:hypothetical protein
MASAGTSRKITISVLAEFFGFRSGSEATKQFCGLIKESKHVDAWLEYREDNPDVKRKTEVL